MGFFEATTARSAKSSRFILSPYGDISCVRHLSPRRAIAAWRYTCLLVTTDPGELLRTVRRRHEVKQSELARRVKTSQSVISDYERGARSPTVEYLAEMLDALGEELRLDAQPKKSVRKKSGNILYDPR